jgi:uncharacterized protein YuzE
VGEDGRALESSGTVAYDPEVDVLRVVLSDALIEESDEATPGLIVDYDAESDVVGVEVLDASVRVRDPRSNAQ